MKFSLLVATLFILGFMNSNVVGFIPFATTTCPTSNYFTPVATGITMKSSESTFTTALMMAKKKKKKNQKKKDGSSVAVEEGLPKIEYVFGSSSTSSSSSKREDKMVAPTQAPSNDDNESPDILQSLEDASTTVETTDNSEKSVEVENEAAALAMEVAAQAEAKQREDEGKKETEIRQLAEAASIAEEQRLAAEEARMKKEAEEEEARKKKEAEEEEVRQMQLLERKKREEYKQRQILIEGLTDQQERWGKQKSIMEARKQPKLPDEEARLSAKYSAIDNLEDRALTILKDLHLI